MGSDLPWEFLTRYAVVNLGYCSVSSLPHGARIRFRAQIIAQPALAAAIHWLAELKASRAVVSILRDAWTHEIFWSKWAAIGHLSAQADAQLVTRRGDFSARRRRLDDLHRFPPLADLVRHARERRDIHSTEAFSGLVEGPLQRRALVLVPSQNATRLTIKEWGTGYRVYSKSWLGQSKGLNVEDQRDFVYACKAAESYRTAWMERQTMLEDVDARILDETGRLVHVRYTRVIVPMTDAGGEPVLMGRLGGESPAVGFCSKNIRER